jgi:hypothetical protein
MYTEIYFRQPQRREISSSAERLLCSQEEPYPVELVTCKLRNMKQLKQPAETINRRLSNKFPLSVNALEAALQWAV